MLNRHGTRLDIGTADDIVELNIAEARRRKEATAGNSSSVGTGAPFTVSRTTGGSSSASARASSAFRGGTAAPLFPPAASFSAPVTMTSERVPPQQPQPHLTPSSSMSVQSSATAARSGGGGGDRLAMDRTSSAVSGDRQRFGHRRLSRGSGFDGLSPTTGSGVGVSPEGAPRPFPIPDGRQYPPPHYSRRPQTNEGQPGLYVGRTSVTGGGAQSPSPLDRAGDPFAGLDNVDEEEGLRRPSRVSGRLPP